MDFDKFLSEFATKRCEEVSKKMDFDKKSSEIIKKTSLRFNDEQKEIFLEFLDEINYINSLYEEQLYIQGIKDGIKIMTD